MAKGKLKASLREFLLHGTLGPVEIGTPMQAVGECLGPPEYWSFAEAGIPCFWGYEHLELRVSHRAPYKVESIQLARADELGGAGVSLGRAMRLELNGLDGRMRPSEIMRRGHWPSDAVDITIQLIAGEVQFRIGCYPVDML